MSALEQELVILKKQNFEKDEESLVHYKELQTYKDSLQETLEKLAKSEDQQQKNKKMVEQLRTKN